VRISALLIAVYFAIAEAQRDSRAVIAHETHEKYETSNIVYRLKFFVSIRVV
jgi:hypothetical protein